MASLLMDVLFFLGRFEIESYEIENKQMDTSTGQCKHTLTIQLKKEAKP